MNKILLSIAVCITLNASSLQVFKNGSTYKISEDNVIKLFKEHVANNKGSIEKRVEQEKVKMKERVENYKPKNLSVNLPTAQKDKTFYPDMEYVLKEDIKDSYGKVLYQKGFKFNPLHYIAMSDRYVFIDYTDKKQREWLKKEKYNSDITTRIIITNGKVFDAIKEFKREVFYASDILIDKFKLEAVPSVVEQEQDRVKVTQIKLEEYKQ